MVSERLHINYISPKDDVRYAIQYSRDSESTIKNIYEYLISIVLNENWMQMLVEILNRSSPSITIHDESPEIAIPRLVYEINKITNEFDELLDSYRELFPLSFEFETNESDEYFVADRIYKCLTTDPDSNLNELHDYMSIKAKLASAAEDFLRENLFKWLVTGIYTVGLLSGEDVRNYLQYTGPFEGNLVLGKILKLANE